MAEDNTNTTPQDDGATEVAEAQTDEQAQEQSDRPDEPQAAPEQERQASDAADEEPEIPTAVSLGLLPENFVSRVSTTLNFYAPDIRLFPPIEAAEDDRDEQGADAGGNRSSRRRRRRGGSGGDGQGEARKRVVEVVTEPQRIKGSTRLEAKKQRRRDGREAGRRRTVVTEAEFLARRESVDRQMVVRSKQNRTQIGVLEDGVLVEHYVARAQDASLIGNVYLGR